MISTVGSMLCTVGSMLSVVSSTVPMLQDPGCRHTALKGCPHDGMHGCVISTAPCPSITPWTDEKQHRWSTQLRQRGLNAIRSPRTLQGMQQGYSACCMSIGVSYHDQVCPLQGITCWKTSAITYTRGNENTNTGTHQSSSSSSAESSLVQEQRNAYTHSTTSMCHSGLFPQHDVCDIQDQGIDPFKSDVWSLGVLLFVMLTGVIKTDHEGCRCRGAQD